MTCLAVCAPMRPNGTEAMGSSMNSPTWMSARTSTASIRRISRSGDSSSMSSGCTTQRRKVSYSPVSRSMETRASMSPPCFLRVADASAASSASKITLLSTPFSLETASTTNRISLFMALSLALRFQFIGKIGHQAGLADAAQGQLVQHAVHFDHHFACLAAPEGACETAPPVQGQLQFDPGLLTGEAREIHRLAQRPVQARRGHLQG